jgi:4-hydroxybenzoate polyprenyltransferase
MGGPFVFLQRWAYSIMRGLLRASHFQPTVAVTAITAALAVRAGRGAAGTVAVVVAVLAGQLSVGWSNDYVDRERDRRAGRVDKPIVAGEVDGRTVGWAAVVALVLVVPLSMLSGWRAGLVHVLAVAVAWAYNLWLKRTVLSVVPYALAFAALPAFVTLGLPGHPWPPAWAVGAAAAMGAGAHFVNGLADREADARTGVRGLPQHLSPLAGLVTAALLMGLAVGLIAVGLPDRSRPAVAVLVLGGLAVLAVVAAALTGRERAAWSLTLVAAGATVVSLAVSGASLVA